MTLISSKMSPIRQFLIRDAIADDISLCLTLDASYSTDYVWQVSIQTDYQVRTITLREEKLPRQMDVAYPLDKHRLMTAIAPEHAFLVAANESGSVYGYLVMTQDTLGKTGHIREIVVDKSYRRQGIATRLLKVASRWATQHQLNRLFFETQTKNYPAVQLCQRLGFSFCGFNDQYFSNHDIAIFFSKGLNLS